MDKYKPINLIDINLDKYKPINLIDINLDKYKPINKQIELLKYHTTKLDLEKDKEIRVIINIDKYKPIKKEVEETKEDTINLDYDRLLINGKLIFKEKVEKNEEEKKRLNEDREIKKRCLIKLIYELKIIIFALCKGNMNGIEDKYRPSDKKNHIIEIEYPTKEEILLNNKFKKDIDDILLQSNLSGKIQSIKCRIDWAYRMLATPSKMFNINL